ncbi:hypothetical protein [Fusobacterium animalis]|uniref:hypothetical protein n=1 Tax=Fusobacterium animalis TaxID=76859 RepID=UPI0030CF6A54
MKTITKKKDFIYIVYDEELLKKIYTSIQCNIILCLILVLYTSESYNNYINYIYVYIVFYILFIMDYNNQIPFFKIGVKIKITIYNDRIEILRRRKNHLHLYGEIKNIEYKTKKFGTKDYYLLKITKTNKKVYKYKLGLIEEEVLEIFTIIKNNYEEWRRKNYEGYNKEN